MSVDLPSSTEPQVMKRSAGRVSSVAASAVVFSGVATNAVVAASVTVLVVDFFLTRLLISILF